MKKKVSYSKYPVLRMLKSKKYFDKLIKTTETFTEISKYDKKYLSYLKSLTDNDKEIWFSEYKKIENISLFSESYQRAVNDSLECLKSILMKKAKEYNNSISEAIFSILKVEKETSGFFILPNKSITSYLFYKLDPETKQISIQGLQSDTKVSFIIFVSDIESITNTGGESIEMKTSTTGMIVEGEDLPTVIMSTLYFLIFKEVADTEQEIIEIVDERKLPKGLSQLQKQCKLNAMEGDITVDYYTANWYTEIIRNTGFKVRGHFRNQPYKDGYRMIFIMPYEKTGYHRRAEKDKPL